MASCRQVAIEKLASDSSDSDSSNSDDSVARAPATDGQRHADGTASSATAAEAKLAAQLAKDPWGRFGGRQGKIARIRAQEEAQLAALAAKLAPPQPPAVAPAKGGKRKKSGAAVGADAAGLAPAKRKKGSKAAAPATLGEGAAPAEAARARVVVVADPVADKLSAAHTAFQPTPQSGWWGSKRFTSAGAMGSVRYPSSLILTLVPSARELFGKACKAALSQHSRPATAMLPYLLSAYQRLENAIGCLLPWLGQLCLPSNFCSCSASLWNRCFRLPWIGWSLCIRSAVSVLQTGSGMQPAGGKDRTGFTENTQEDLYMALHNAKSSGKTGLGKGRGSGAQHKSITQASNSAIPMTLNTTWLSTKR